MREAGARSLRLSVAVHNAMLAEALSAAAVRAGWVPVAARHEGTVLVTDRAPARPAGNPPGNRVVLVCEPTPYGARKGLDAISELTAAGLVCADAPGDVGCALDGLARRQASVPLRVLELAAQMPAITDRQIEVLSAVAAGQSNTEICRNLHLSAASVKRELAVLYCALGAATRSVLAATALELGVSPSFRPVSGARPRQER